MKKHNIKATENQMVLAVADALGIRPKIALKLAGYSSNSPRALSVARRRFKTLQERLNSTGIMSKLIHERLKEILSIKTNPDMITPQHQLSAARLASEIMGQLEQREANSANYTIVYKFPDGSVEKILKAANISLESNDDEVVEEDVNEVEEEDISNEGKEDEGDNRTV